MEKNNEKIDNLGKKIYLLMYSRPRYKAEISNMIYRRECKAIYPEIKKLEKLKWIKQIDYKKPTDYKDPKPNAGKRANRRQYYIAKIDPIMEVISRKVKLDDFDRYVLRNILESRAFRGVIDQSDIDSIQDPINCILGPLDSFSAFLDSEKVKKYWRFKVETKEEYDGVLSIFNRFFCTSEITEAVLNGVPVSKEAAEWMKNSGDWFKLVLIPKCVLEKIKGMTWIGRSYPFFETVFNSIPSTVEFQKVIGNKPSSKLEEMMKKHFLR